MFIKHRVTELETIRDWCQNIDLGRNLPLLAVRTGKSSATRRCTSNSAVGNGTSGA